MEAGNSSAEQRVMKLQQPPAFPQISQNHGCSDRDVGIVLNYCQYGVLYLGSYYNTAPYIIFPYLENSNLGKLPCRKVGLGFGSGLSSKARALAFSKSGLT